MRTPTRTPPGYVWQYRYMFGPKSRPEKLHRATFDHRGLIDLARGEGGL